MKSICVFCGSGTGGSEAFAKAASGLGHAIASRGLDLVYGGSNIGLMGIVSGAARDGGSHVTGVIPERIAAHVPEQQGIHLETVTGMHERKNLMYRLSDAFIALPGGIGTLEEFFEAWTWNQLGYHSKPLGLLNVNGYFDNLIRFLDRMTEDEFLRRSQRRSPVLADRPEDLLTALAGWQPAEGLKWEKSD